eukprot:1377579-Rhodomonas_salina.1
MTDAAQETVEGPRPELAPDLLADRFSCRRRAKLAVWPGCSPSLSQPEARGLGSAGPAAVRFVDSLLFSLSQARGLGSAGLSVSSENCPRARSRR